MQKILIVDDELFFREFISDNITKAGYAAIAAQGGAEALNILVKDEGEIHAVLLDIVMPGMDGLETMERIKKINPRLPIIIMTAHTNQEMVLKALKSGAFDYMAKPLYLEELLLALKRACDHYSLVIQNDGKLRQLKNIEEGAQQLLEIAKGSMRMGAVIENNRLLQATIDLIASVLDAERVSMSLVDEAKKEMRVAVANGSTVDIASFPPRKVGEGISGRVAEKGEPILVSDINDSAGIQASKFSSQYKTNSFMCAPIKVQGKTIGVISVNDKRGGVPFTEEDLTVLMTFSHQIELTIENAMINAEMERHIEKLTLINSISRTLLALVDPKEIFRDIVKKTREAIEVDVCALFICEEATGELKFEIGLNEGGEMHHQMTIKPGEGITGKVIEDGRMALINDVKGNKTFNANVDGLPGTDVKGMMCVPLTIKDKHLGVLKVINKKDGLPFTQRDTGLLESIAIQASIGLKNGWLYQNLVSSVDEVATANMEIEKITSELKLRLKEIEKLKKGKV